MNGVRQTNILLHLWQHRTCIVATHFVYARAGTLASMVLLGATHVFLHGKHQVAVFGAEVGLSEDLRRHVLLRCGQWTALHHLLRRWKQVTRVVFEIGVRGKHLRSFTSIRAFVCRSMGAFDVT